MSKIMHMKILGNLLSRDADTIIQNAKDNFLQIIKECGEAYVLFGAGPLGKQVLHDLRSVGIEPLGFADNNSNLWGKNVDGLPVYSPGDATIQFEEKALFIITVYTNQPVIRQLQNLGVKFTTFASLAWYYSEAMLPHGDLDLPYQIFHQAQKVQKAFGLWHDELSREEYLAQLKWRTSLQMDNMPMHLSPDEIYFPTDLVKFSEDECFVDCGAFDGDSIDAFLRLCKYRFKKIWAIEPDPKNYKHLQKRIQLYDEKIVQKVNYLRAAVGSVSQKIAFDATGTAGSTMGKGSCEVDSIPLDIILKSDSPTYIKMDIEGTEIEALLGAKQLIKKHLPILAVCAYHKQDHLWEIPLLIQSLSKDYEFFLRRYSDECWELVCYAIPKERLKG
ncbi:MAG: FkbM family methyltransferase [Syntrophales bacterium]